MADVVAGAEHKRKSLFFTHKLVNYKNKVFEIYGDYIAV